MHTDTGKAHTSRRVYMCVCVDVCACVLKTTTELSQRNESQAKKETRQLSKFLSRCMDGLLLLLFSFCLLLLLLPQKDARGINA